jgi:hypothetical protein
MKKSLSKTVLNNKINLLLEKKLGVIYFNEWMAQNYGWQWYDVIPKAFHPAIKKWFETNQGQTPPPNWYDIIDPDEEIFDEPERDTGRPDYQVPFSWDIITPGRVTPYTLPFFGMEQGSDPSAYPENYPGYPFGGTVNNDLPGGGANDGVR